MDEKQKKILLIGGALLIGAFLLSQRQPDVIGGGVGTVTDWIIKPTPPENGNGAPMGGGDVYTYYDIYVEAPTYPERGNIIPPLPEGFFAPQSANGGGGGITSVKKVALVSAPLQPLAEISPVFTSVAERVAKVKEKMATKKEVSIPETKKEKKPEGLFTSAFDPFGFLTSGAFISEKKLSSLKPSEMA